MIGRGGPARFSRWLRSENRDGPERVLRPGILAGFHLWQGGRFAAGQIVLSSCRGGPRGGPTRFFETDEPHTYMRNYINEPTKRLILKDFTFQASETKPFELRGEVFRELREGPR